MGSKRVVTCAVVLASVLPLTRAAAIPAFARMHRVSCSLCHDPIPRLNAFGAMFVSNGYRFAPEQSAPDAAPTGDPLLQLPQLLRLAMRVDAYATAYAPGKLTTDFQTPYTVKVMSGGPLSDAFSYYLYFMLSERGATGSIEDAYVTWNRVGHAPVNLSVGQFQISDPVFPRELRLEYQDYAIYRARIGDSRSDLTYDRGLMVSADVAGFALLGELLNGNGTGEASSSRRFDNDRNKSLFGRIGRDLGKGVRLGGLGFVAHETATLTGGSTALNKMWMLGGDATVTAGPVEFRGQFIHREDGNPTFTPGEAKGVTNGGFGEVLWHRPATRWYAIALYNRIDTNRPLLDVRLGGAAGLSRYEAITGGAGYLLRRNVRAYAEGTWDRELRTTQWTLGLTLAF